MYPKQYKHYIAWFTSNQRQYTLSTTNEDSDTKTTLPLDTTPAAHLKENKYFVHHACSYKSKSPKITRTWEKNVSLMGSYNKAMINTL